MPFQEDGVTSVMVPTHLLGLTDSHNLLGHRLQTLLLTMTGLK